MVIGNGAIYSYLAAAADANSLAHAYALIGPSHVGKSTLAREIAAKVLHVASAQLRSHPDFITVSRLEDEKTGKRKNDITVNQARELRERLSQRSWAGGYQVAIIEEAERLNTESANALLKILEEPPEKSLIFLLAPSDADLLPTLRSRSHVLYLQRVSGHELGAALKQYPATEVAQVVPLAAGLPGRALTLLENADELQDVVTERTRWENLRGQPFYKQLAELEPLFTKDESENSRDKFSQVLQWWQLWWAQTLVDKSPAPKNIVAICDVLEQSQKALRQNVNPRLVAEVLLQHF
jgi:DNA polymerase III gamma/tau subunit